MVPCVASITDMGGAGCDGVASIMGTRGANLKVDKRVFIAGGKLGEFSKKRKYRLVSHAGKLTTKEKLLYPTLARALERKCHLYGAQEG